MAATAIRRSGRDGQLPAILLFLPPALLLFTIFVVLPIGEAAWYSGFNWNGFGRPTNWVGFDNYLAVFDTRAFGLALRNNGLIIVVSLLVQLPLALTLAIMLAEKFRGSVCAAHAVLHALRAGGDRHGPDLQLRLRRRLRPARRRSTALFGAEAPHLLASTQTSMFAILIVIVWKYFGFHMMLFIAALQGMDRNLIEAARIDGATRAQQLRYIVIPLLYPTIRLSVFFAVVGSLQLFDLVMPLTRGGPADSSQTMVSFLYTHGVTRMRVGYGSAIGVILFVICVTVAFTYKRWFMRDE